MGNHLAANTLARSAGDASSGTGGPDAAVQSGITLHQSGRIAEAAEVYRRVLAVVPEHAEANHLLGLTLFQTGHHDEAAALIGKALRKAPFNAAYHSNLGAVLKAKGDPEAAIKSLERSLLIDPRQPVVESSLGVALWTAGRPVEAAAAQRRALAMLPDFAGAHMHLATALAMQGLHAEARRHAERAVALAPDSADVHAVLGRILLDMREGAPAAVALARAVKLRPDAANCRDLGVALLRINRLDDAKASAGAAVTLMPDNPELRLLMGEILMAQGDYPQAVVHIEEAVSRGHRDAKTMNWLGTALISAGRVEDARRALRASLDADPTQFPAASSLLFSKNYDFAYSGAELAREARALGQQIEAQFPARQHYGNSADPDRPLRVGVFSGDLANSVIARFVETLLPAIDGERLLLHAYSVREPEDETSQRLKRSFRVWHAAKKWPDAELAEVIAADEIDILVDLQGHTGEYRLPMLARKPAPVAVTWLGYSGTTGLSAIDYILGDRFVTPASATDDFSEAIWQMPDSYLCFAPPPAAPLVAAAPALSNGYVTFGSFNNINKLNPQNLALWGKVLDAVPNSRLLLKSRALDDALVAREMRQSLEAAGIDNTRVDLLGYTKDASDQLGAYGRLDIALDPFPYNGTTTTCEALWMGVPVLGIKGNRFIANVGESILNTAGLSDWLAADEADFVAKAARYAADIGALAALRQTIRPMMAASPLCDAPRFARHFEAALRGMWQHWCAEQGR